MHKLIIANWKMRPDTSQQALGLASAVSRGIKNIRNVDVVLAPPFLYIPAVSQIIKHCSWLKLGAQDVFYENGGAYTGEISASQLKSFGVRLVIVGHSERRALGDTDEIVNKKLKASLEAGLKTVLCVGEKEKRKEIVFPEIIRKELNQGLKGIKKSLFKNLIIAYEPVWAIGTKRADTPKNVYEMSLMIRRELYRTFGKAAVSRVPMLYGGSVDEKNATQFVKDGAADGLLIGGSSLNPKKFVKIVKNISSI